MMPMKMPTWLARRNDAKAIAKIRPKYLARSATSILRATKFMATSLHPTRAASGSAVLTVGRTEIDITSNDDQLLNGVQPKAEKICPSKRSPGSLLEPGPQWFER